MKFKVRDDLLELTNYITAELEKKGLSLKLEYYIITQVYYKIVLTVEVIFPTKETFPKVVYRNDMGYYSYSYAQSYDEGNKTLEELLITLLPEISRFKIYSTLTIDENNCKTYKINSDVCK